jgi:histidyl-tRNA synthetase
MLSEAEFLGVATAFFQYWKIPAVIKVNNRKLLNGLLEQAGITKKSEALIAIDKLDKIGVTGVSAELINRGYSPEQTEKLFTYIKEGITLSSLRGIVYNEEGKQGLLELEEVFSYAKAMGVDNLSFDISLARGQAYYTGIVFEVYAQGGEVKSSLAGGGRYDDMIGKFIGGGRQIPAVGLSFGLAPIMDVLRLRGDILGKSSAQVYVVPINTPLESLQVVQQLRFAGIKADFSQSKKGVSKNLEYASALGIPYVILIGGDEVAQKKVLLRDMNDGTEQLLSVKDVIGKLKK